jgi:sugar lactone lactonase YvrE
MHRHFAFVLAGSLLLGVSSTAHARGSVLAEGARLHGANGMNVGPDGRLYVASFLGGEIAVVNRHSGAIVSRLDGSDGVDGPDDLTFGPDGSLYWTSLMTGNVVRRSPSGDITQQYVAPGVNPITFSDTGRLFVALDFLGDGLYELDPELSAPPRFITGNLGFMNGMDWGPDGRLYGPIWTQGRVVSIDVDSCTGAVAPEVECDIQTVADGFFIPAAVKFDGLGRLHAVDQNGEVVRIDVATGAKEVLAVLPVGLDNLAIDAQNELYVSSAAEGFVVRIEPDGQVRALLRGGMILPGGVAVVSAGGGESVYVADLASLREFDGDTGAPLGVTPSFLGVTELHGPATVSADGSSLIFSSWFASVVQVYDPATGSVLETHSDFASPLNAVRFQGDLVVAELGATPGAARVVRQTSGGPVTLAPMTVPSGLAVSGGDLWAADWATGAVLQLVSGGVTLSPPLEVAAGLDRPEGMAVDLDGTLLVVESGKRRLLRVDPSTGGTSVVARRLEVGLDAITRTVPTFALSSVAVGASGAIYVSGDKGNVIYRF